MWWYRLGIIALLIGLGGGVYWFQQLPEVSAPVADHATTPNQIGLVAHEPERLIPLARPGTAAAEDTNREREETAQTWLNRVFRLLDSEELTAAHQQIVAGLQIYPQEIGLYEALAQYHFKTQNLDAVTALIERLRTLFPDRSLWRVNQLQLWIAQQDLDKLRDFFTRLPVDQSALQDWDFYRAIWYSITNDHQAAQELLKQLTAASTVSETIQIRSQGVLAAYEQFESYEDSPSAHQWVLLAKGLAAHNEFSLAKLLADLAIQEQVRYPDGWILRGYSNLLLKRSKEALADLQYAYNLDPLRAETHYFLALAYDENGEAPAAALFFEKALESPTLGFSAEIRWKLIELYHRLRKYERLFELYTQALDQNSAENHFTTAIYVGLNLLQDPSRVLAYTTQLLAQQPQDELMMNLHGWALMEDGQASEALAILKAALQQNPESPRTHLNLGLWYEQQGQSGTALQHYQKCQALSGDQERFASIARMAGERYDQLVAQGASTQTDPTQARPAAAP